MPLPVDLLICYCARLLRSDSHLFGGLRYVVADRLVPRYVPDAATTPLPIPHVAPLPYTQPRVYRPRLRAITLGPVTRSRLRFTGYGTLHLHWQRLIWWLYG